MPKSSFTRRKTTLFGLVVVPLALAGGTWFSLGRFDAEGERFYHQGRAVVETLDRFAGALKRRDLTAVEGFYSPSFRGASLGLASLEPAAEKDGVADLRFTSGVEFPHGVDQPHRSFSPVDDGDTSEH